MNSEITIIAQIERMVNGHYQDWQIGVTNNPRLRKAQAGNPIGWIQWQTNTKKTANYIMYLFLQKGMQNAGMKPEPGNCVFIMLAD